MSSNVWAARAWLVACIAVGLALVVAYPGSYYQDAALHFLRARWVWAHPWMLVDVWDRPLFTAVYALPARLPLLGGTAYSITKMWSVALSAATAWLTYDLARGYGLPRPALAIPLYWLQPTVFLLSAETSPEPLFALLLVLALRLLQEGRLVVGTVTASLLVLVRPEGIVVAAVWAWWVLRDRRGHRTIGGRLGTVLWLALAPAVWWYLAAQVTQDPLFIVHDWPPLSAPLGGILAGAGLDPTVLRWREIMGAALAVPFAVGAVVSLWRRELGVPLSVILAVAVVHGLAARTGVFGWAPVPSTFACIAPAIAVVMLAGWAVIARWVTGALPARTRLRTIGAALVLLISAAGDLLYVDAQAEGRDWRAVSDATAWFSSHPEPLTAVLWSVPYSDVLFGHDPMESVLRFGDRNQVLRTMDSVPARSLVVWDGVIGPASYHVSGADIERAGYTALLRRAYTLHGRVPASAWGRPGVPQLAALVGLGGDSVRRQEMWLLYRR